MAVGMIIECERCGTSYDEGKGGHWQYQCDVVLERQADADVKLAVFNARSIDERLEIIYKALVSVKQQIRDMPFDGPIG